MGLDGGLADNGGIFPSLSQLPAGVVSDSSLAGDPNMIERASLPQSGGVYRGSRVTSLVTGGWDIWLAAGQSNMLGLPTDFDATNIDTAHPRVWQYANSGAYQGQIVRAFDPLAHPANSTGMGPALTFARWLVESIAPDRRVLIVPAAVGGTGLSTGDWSVGGALYLNAIAYVNAALALLASYGADAKVRGIIWHQGEADATNGGGVSQATYAALLDAMIAGFRTAFGNAALPFVLGQMNPDYIAVGTGTIGQINAAHIDTPRRVVNTAFAYGIAGSDYTGSSPTYVHYEVAGQRAMGRNMFGALAIAQTNILGVAPSAPTGLTLTQSGTTINVAWTRPICRATDYTVQYRVTGAGSWTTLTRAQNIDPSAAITGLSLGTSYDVQVATVNEQGTSAFATATLALVVLPGQDTALANGTMTASTAPLSWTPGSGAATHLVEYKKHVDSVWLSAGTTAATSLTVGGLAAATSYDFRVTAQNAAGSASPSTTLTVSTTAIAYLLTDVSAAPVAAYSAARRLKSGYAGNCIQVRRSSDNATQDIGFVGDSMDTASLLTFCGAGNGFITKWYDQSGNARDLGQATTANQPKIVASGVLNTVNSLPAILFDGTASYLFALEAGLLYAGGAASGMVVAMGTGPANGGCLVGEDNAGTGNRYLPCEANSNVSGHRKTGADIANSVNTQLLAYTDTAAGDAIWDNTALCQETFVDSGTQITYTHGGANPGSSATYTRTGSLTLTRLTVGGHLSAALTNLFAGNITEVVVWASALSAPDQSAGAANQHGYFSTT